MLMKGSSLKDSQPLKDLLVTTVSSECLGMPVCKALVSVCECARVNRALGNRRLGLLGLRLTGQAF